MNNFYIYHLVDPVTDIPFYVGKGRNRRMYKHEENVRRNSIPNNNRHLFYKIRSILTNGNTIVYKQIFTNLSEADAFQKEQEEIQRLGLSIHGGKLCNLTFGGDGACGYKYTPKQRLRAKETHNTSQYKRYVSQHWIQYYKNPITRQFQTELRKKSWREGKYKAVVKEWIFLNPNKEIVKITNLRKFCRENGLGTKSAPAHLRQVHLGLRKQYKGWTKYPT